MSFAQLRQTVLQNHALSLDRFAETVQISSPADAETLLDVRAKIEFEQAGTKGGPSNESRRGTIDERERIQVTVSRDPNFAGSYPSRPQPASVLYRAETRDSDRRPYVFHGEVAYEGDQHAVYVFERPRRVAQGRG